MKKTLITFLFAFSSILLNAQIQKVLNITQGNLSSSLTTSEKNTITDLTIIGKIDSRDFKTIRDNLPNLTSLDISNVTINAYTGTEGTYSTSTYAYPENHIPKDAFFNINDNIGDNISDLKLKTIKLPTNITSIDANAFKRCSHLESILIPASVKNIEDYAFLTCSAKIQVDANNTFYTSKDDVLFNKNCDTLIFCPTSKTDFFSIPLSVTCIYKHAFNGCNISSVFLPPNIQSIGVCAFYNCKLINSINIPSTISIIETSTFSGCIKLNTIDLPESITTIYSQAFKDCYNLDSINIPKSVTVIGLNAFKNSTAYIQVDTNNLKYASIDGVLFDKNIEKLIQCPISKIGEYTIPNSVTTIENSAFYNCGNLIKINTPLELTMIKEHAFANCTALRSIIFPTTLQNIQPYSFYNCSSLTSINSNIEIPNYITDVFLLCNSNLTIYIPKNTKEIYTYRWGSYRFIEGQNFWLSKTEIEIPQNAQNNIFTNVFSNTNWNISTNADWISLNNNEMSNDDTLFFSVTENLGKKRIANINISSLNINTQSIQIIQNAGPYNLLINETTVNIPISNTAQFINITSDSSWNIVNVPSWLEIYPLSGKGDCIVSIKAIENLPKSDYHTKITITNNIILEDIEISFNNITTHINSLEELNFDVKYFKQKLLLEIKTSEKISISIYSLSGNLIDKFYVEENQTNISFGNFPKGIYIIIIKNKDGVKKKMKINVG